MLGEIEPMGGEPCFLSIRRAALAIGGLPFVARGITRETGLDLALLRSCERTFLSGLPFVARLTKLKKDVILPFFAKATKGILRSCERRMEARGVEPLSSWPLP